MLKALKERFLQWVDGLKRSSYNTARISPMDHRGRVYKALDSDMPDVPGKTKTKGDVEFSMVITRAETKN